jgi:hypothetical protein
MSMTTDTTAPTSTDLAAVERDALAVGPAATPEAIADVLGRLDEMAWDHSGEIRQPSPFVPLTIRGAAAVVHLTRGKVALIDMADWRRVCFYKWHTVGPMPSGQFYASNGRRDYLHRFVMRARPDQLVDHRRNDGLDCRRSNLRTCDVPQNQANRHARHRPSGVKGVHWNKNARKWCAQIRVRGRRLYLGLFPTEVEAGAAYDAAAVEHWGEFSNGNNTGPGPATS